MDEGGPHGPNVGVVHREAQTGEVEGGAEHLELGDDRGADSRVPALDPLPEGLAAQLFVAFVDAFQTNDTVPPLLPETRNFKPSGSGESPLANLTDWLTTTAPISGAPARRETNTMPQWAGSCWYFLRYAAPHCDTARIPS